MTVYFTHDTAKVDVEDLPMEELAKIQDATGIPNWWEIGPIIKHARGAELLARACARFAGVALPDVLTPKLMSGLFTVENTPNIAEVFDDGIPDPKAEDAPPTT